MHSPENSAPVTPRRRLLFTLLAAAIPVLFFVLLEFGLRLAGARAVYPLFIDHPQQPQYRLANPQVIKRYFGDADRAPTMQIETVYFRADKPADVVRLVVQGGSSAAGFPYGFGASLTGMLEQRLRRVYPQREIEVINTAMSAVNSYTLLDFADEIVAIEPDAVLIYAGHNEYLGILGVGSAFLGGHSALVTRAYLRLRRLALFQVLQRLYPGAAANDRAAQQSEAQAQGTMMSRVAADKEIVLGSRAFEQGRRQFERNLGRLVGRYTEAGIPVYVATLVSNEKDLAPFNSVNAPDTDFADWRSEFAAVRAAVAAHDVAAPARARALVNADEQSADAWYLLGRASYDAGDVGSARAAFQQARDRDALRFRAPGMFNAIVRSSTAGGARIVDVEAAFRAESADGILGESLLLEHVHPNVRGYFLLADAFFDALSRDGLLGDALAPVDDRQAWREIPVSEIDRLFGEYKIALIKSNWPFSETAARPDLPDPDSVPSLLAQKLYRQNSDWTSVHRELVGHYRSIGDTQNLTRVALILADAFPFASPFQYQAGVALIEAGRQRQAVNYLYRGAQLAPRDVNLLLALSHALVLNGARDQALGVLERVLALEPDNATAKRVSRQLRSPSRNDGS